MQTDPIRTVLAGLLARMTLLGCYPNLPTDAKRQTMWVETFAEALAGTPPDELEAAFRAYLTSTDPADRFPPTPGRLLALTPTRGRMQVEADAAGGWYQRARRARGSIGGNSDDRTADLRRHLRDPHPAVLDAVLAGIEAVGGWHALGMTMDDDHGAGRRFEAAFRAALMAPTTARAQLTVVPAPRALRG